MECFAYTVRLPTMDFPHKFLLPHALPLKPSGKYVCLHIHPSTSILEKDNLEFGIIHKNISGHDVLITDIERTVCDAIKYRNKIGLDVCGEVIDNYLKKETRNISLLHEYAQRLRVKNILTIYLETRL